MNSDIRRYFAPSVAPSAPPMRSFVAPSMRPSASQVHMKTSSEGHAAADQARATFKGSALLFDHLKSSLPGPTCRTLCAAVPAPSRPPVHKPTSSMKAHAITKPVRERRATRVQAASFSIEETDDETDESDDSGSLDGFIVDDDDVPSFCASRG